MEASKFVELVVNKIGTDNAFVSRSISAIKGVAVYIVFFNSRFPDTKMSPTTITNQTVFDINTFSNNKEKDPHFDYPMRLKSYKKTVPPNSIFVYIDLAGHNLTKDLT